MPSPAAFLQSVKLPVLSEVAHRLIQTLDDPDASVSTVRDVIALDPALTTTLLRMANSALFGLSRTVNSLDHAVNVVGMSLIRARALSICLSNVFPSAAGLDRTEFWRSSLACAGYARHLAARLGLDEQQAWLTGMMLRLGALLIGQQDPALMEAFERLPRGPGERWARQRGALGFDECQLTGELARRWDFPAEMVTALNAGGQPMAEPPFSPLGAVLHLAGLLADGALSTPPVAVDLPKQVMVKLQLDSETLAAELPDVQSFTETSTDAA